MHTRDTRACVYFNLPTGGGEVGDLADAFLPKPNSFVPLLSFFGESGFAGGAEPPFDVPVLNRDVPVPTPPAAPALDGDFFPSDPLK